MVFVIHIAGFDEGIVLQRLSLFWDILLTADIRKRYHFKLITQNLSDLCQLVQVVGGKYDFHFLLLIFDFHIHLIESFAIDTNNGALRNERIRVDHLDQTEHIDALVLLGEDTEYLHLLSCIPPVTIEYGYTVIHLCTNGVGYLLPLS